MQLSELVSAFALSPDAVVVSDACGRVISSNDAFGRLFGVQLSPGYDLLTDPLLARAGVRPALQAAHAGEPHRLSRISWEPANPDTTGPGSARPFEVDMCLTPIKGPDGQTVGVISVLREIARERSFDRDRSLVERSIVGIHVGRLDGSILAANPEACRVLGCTEAELIAGGRASILDPTDPRIDEALERRRRTGEFRGNVRYRRKDGSTFEAEVTSSVFLDQDGSELVSVVFRDVTDRLRAERALRHEEASLRALLDAVSEAVFATDASGRVVRMNRPAALLTGVPADQAIGRPLTEVLNLEDDPASRDLVVRRADGVRRVVVGRVNPVVPFAEEGAGQVATFRDVTVERLAAADLDQTRQRYETYLSSTRDTLWEWDLETNALTWGERIDTFGYNATDSRGGLGWWTERIHPEDYDRVTAGFALAVASGAQSWSEEYRFRRSNGRWAHVIDRASIIADSHGRPRRVIGILMDVTELKEMQLSLERADRLASLGTLAAGVAHEINNPLAFLLSNLNYAAEELSATHRRAADLDEVATALGEALEGAHRVRNIVRDLKAMTRIEDEAVTAVDLHAVLDSAVLMLSSELRHRVRVIKEYGEVAQVRGAEGRLSQVLVNLLLNAVQAMPDSRERDNELRIRTVTLANRRVAVEIQDNGCGIPRENLRRIFDPFFTTKPVGVGTGLGLYICHRMVTAMGGEIEVNSEVGAGTMFRIVFNPASP